MLPRRGFLACAQPHDRVAHPHRLARLERDIAALAVALVEQPQHRDPLRHRRRTGFVDIGLGHVDRDDVRCRLAALFDRRGRCGRGRRAGRAHRLDSLPGTHTERGHERRPAEEPQARHHSGIQAS
ncbi:MAG TPA: hypothetical protein VM657_11175 [Sphingomonas sp.]|nr:hypothetical protein [Sphingomonas sp.]